MYEFEKVDLIQHLQLMKTQDNWKPEINLDFSEASTSSIMFSKYEHIDGKLAELQSGCTYQINNCILQLGKINEHSMAELKGYQFSDLAFASRFRIVNFGEDSNSWLGIQFRGFKPATIGGYVIYLRANGSLELFDPEYRVVNILQTGYNASHWVDLLVVVHKHSVEIIFSTDGSEILRAFKQDLNFISPGWVSLQTYRTISEFDYFKLWSISTNASGN